VNLKDVGIEYPGGKEGGEDPEHRAKGRVGRVRVNRVKTHNGVSAEERKGDNFLTNVLGGRNARRQQYS